MEILFIANNNLCNLINLKFDLLSQNIDIINSSGSSKNYKSLYNDPDDEIINAINNISTLCILLVRDMQHNCQKVWNLRKYLEKHNGMNGINTNVEHCTHFNDKWDLCTLCAHAEDIMIEIEQLSDLGNLDIIRMKNIWEYKKCISDISVKQCDLLYFIKHLKNAYSNVLFPLEEKIEHPKTESSTKQTEKVECSICISPITHAAYMECFHEFCLGCIKEYIDINLKNRNPLVCPICRQSIKRSIINDVNYKWKVYNN